MISPNILVLFFKDPFVSVCQRACEAKPQREIVQASYSSRAASRRTESTLRADVSNARPSSIGKASIQSMIIVLFIMIDVVMFFLNTKTRRHKVFSLCGYSSVSSCLCVPLNYVPGYFWIVTNVQSSEKSCVWAKGQGCTFGFCTKCTPLWQGFSPPLALLSELRRRHAILLNEQTAQVAGREPHLVGYGDDGLRGLIL